MFGFIGILKDFPDGRADAALQPSVLRPKSAIEIQQPIRRGCAGLEIGDTTGLEAGVGAGGPVPEAAPEKLKIAGNWDGGMGNQ